MKRTFSGVRCCGQWLSGQRRQMQPPWDGRARRRRAARRPRNRRPDWRTARPGQLVSSDCGKCPKHGGFRPIPVEHGPDCGFPPATSGAGRFPLESLGFRSLPTPRPTSFLLTRLWNRNGPPRLRGARPAAHAPLANSVPGRQRAGRARDPASCCISDSRARSAGACCSAHGANALSRCTVSTSGFSPP